MPAGAQMYRTRPLLYASKNFSLSHTHSFSFTLHFLPSLSLFLTFTTFSSSLFILLHIFHPILSFFLFLYLYNTVCLSPSPLLFSFISLFFPPSLYHFLFLPLPLPLPLPLSPF